MNRKLVVGGASLVPGKIRGIIAAGMRGRDEIEALLPPSFFEGAPFERISLMLRFGEKTDLLPQYVRKKGEWLDISVELEMAKLRKATEDEVYQQFRHAILEAVIAVAEKYSLPCQELYEARTPAAPG